MGFDACKPNPRRESMMEFSRLSKSATEQNRIEGVMGYNMITKVGYL